MTRAVNVKVAKEKPRTGYEVSCCEDEDRELLHEMQAQSIFKPAQLAPTIRASIRDIEQDVSEIDVQLEELVEITQDHEEALQKHVLTHIRHSERISSVEAYLSDYRTQAVMHKIVFASVWTAVTFAIFCFGLYYFAMFIDIWIH